MSSPVQMPLSDASLSLPTTGGENHTLSMKSSFRRRQQQQKEENNNNNNNQQGGNNNTSSHVQQSGLLGTGETAQQRFSRPVSPLVTSSEAATNIFRPISPGPQRLMGLASSSSAATAHNTGASMFQQSVPSHHHNNSMANDRSK